MSKVDGPEGYDPPLQGSGPWVLPVTLETNKIVFLPVECTYSVTVRAYNITFFYFL